MFIVRDRETGRAIMAECQTYDEAVDIILAFEEEDKADGNYSRDFYEIVEVEA